MDIVILLAATLLCGAADAWGFVHAARVWHDGVFSWRHALYSAVFFQGGVAMYWVALRTLSAWGVASAEVQTLVWFVATIIGVAAASGQFVRWHAVDQTVACAVLLGIGWLLTRPGAST